MNRNRRWINDQIRNGREIIDIGPDFRRRIDEGYNSSFYEMERHTLRASDYDKYLKVFQRSGENGGVLGLDF